MKTLLCLSLFILAFQSKAQISDFDTIDFRKADRIALECKDDSLDNLPALVYKLTSELSTDVERFRAIYRWVSANIANDYSLYSKNMYRRHRFKDDSLKLSTWNEKFGKLSFKKLLKDKKAICTGYAYLVKKLANLAHINCEMVNGYSRTSTIDVEKLIMPNHSWNAVELNGKWYLCDPTWASGTPHPETFRFEFNYNDGFFLPNPKLFSINHYPEDAKWLLMDDEQLTFESFLKAPIFYGNTYKYLKLYHEPKQMRNTVQKYQKISIKCELLNPVNTKDVHLVLDSGNYSQKVQPTITLSGNELNIEYSFERTGFYDVHLYIGDDLISTYTFKVKG